MQNKIITPNNPANRITGDNITHNIKSNIFIFSYTPNRHSPFTLANHLTRGLHSFNTLT